MTTRGTCVSAALLAAALAGAGCSVHRQPAINVGPSYSIMRDSVALETHMGGPGSDRDFAAVNADDRRPGW